MLLPLHRDRLGATLRCEVMITQFGRYCRSETEENILFVVDTEKHPTQHPGGTAPGGQTLATVAGIAFRQEIC